MSDAVQEQPKASPQLGAERFKLSESVRNMHSICIEEGITRAQVLDPAFLAHVAQKLQRYDRIEVTNDTNTLFAELVVVQNERAWARTYVLCWHDLTTKDVALTQKGKQEAAEAPAELYRIEHKGQHKKWCVIRNADSEIIREVEPSKADAKAWLDGYLKVTG